MDKQFMKVDDLVRQRLGGGEEPMRDGAWMRMNELLDKESDKRKPVFFFWRNTLSVVAALVVLGAGGLGAYRLTNTNSGNETGKLVASAMNGAGEANGQRFNMRRGQEINTPVPAATTADRAANDARLASATNSAAGNSTANHKTNTHNNTNTIATTGKNPEKTTVAAATTPVHTSAPDASGKNPENGAGITAANTSVSTQPAAARTTTVKATSNVNPVTAGVHKHNVGRKESGKNPEMIKGVATAHTGAGKHTIAATATGSNPEETTAATTGVATTTTGNATTGTPETSGNNPEKALKVLAAGTPSHRAKASMASTKTSRKANTQAAGTPLHMEDGEGLTEKLAAETAADRKHTTAGRATKAVPVNDAASAETGNTVAVTGTATAASHRGGAHASTGTGSRKPAVHNMPVASSTNGSSKTIKTAGARLAAITPAEPNAKRERITVNKLTVHQRFFKTSANEGYFSLDTISMEQLTREQTIGGNTASATRMASANGENNVATGGGSETGKAAANDEQVLAAAAQAETPAVTTSKETGADKIKPVSKGSITTAQKLSMAFNDMKSSVRGAQLSMGLTGGINGTFFGPAGFKGFQFGVTSEVTFNDNLSVMGELKYFNRINTGEYSVTDEYFTYEQQGGQYVKVTNLQTASFSNIQSIELPLSARYSSGKFTFYAGGNFSYNFSINADLPTSGTVQNTTVVSAPGANETPQFSIDDFNSRFGIGYLFGMTYRLTPDFSFDLRNVQTLWDNSGTSASKEVSGQLYRHPSFQLSVGYRLGGKKPE